MTTAIKTLEKVRRTADVHKHPSVRRAGSLGDFDYVRQGDIYLHKLPALPMGVKRASKPSAQVAPGSTQGSRHCIGDLSKVTIYEMPNANALQGPIIEAPQGFTMEHPEHGHQQLEAGVYAVTFQRAFAETLRRVAD